MIDKALAQLHFGITFGFYARNGYFSTEIARKEVDEIVNSGIRWVVITPIVAQETYCSTVQFRDFELTPSDLELKGIIDYMHEKGLRVQLRPMLETLDGHGRLQIWFPPDRERIPGRRSQYWEKWFDSMAKRSVHYARLAQTTGCEMYGLDSELDRTVNFSAHWKAVIAAVREVYGGPITSCHTTHMNLVDYDSLLADSSHWFYDLDVLSLSFYHPASKELHESAEAMTKAFKGELERFRRFAAVYKKPILFGECGCTSSAGGARNPSGWTSEAAYDGAEQANYVEALLSTFWDEAWWYGFYWWKWDEQNSRPSFRADPAGDKGFTVKGKPAQQVLLKWSRRNMSRGD